MCDVHIDPPTHLKPGVYPSPRGHTLIVGRTARSPERRSVTIVDLGGAVSIGGVEVEDPDALDALADRLRANAGKLRHRQAHPYPAAVAGCTECVGR